MVTTMWSVRRSRRLPWGLAAAILAAPLARAGEPSWRVFAGPSRVGPSLSTTYVSSYSPPFQYTPYTSAATQVVPLEGASGLGLLLGLERDLGRYLGLQLTVGRGRGDVSGGPGQYDLAMRYTARPPPSYQPVEVSLARAEAQPEATGHLDSLVVALDLTASAELGSRGRLGVGAGPAWLHAEGRAQSLVYTVYYMGGHSTSFYEDHRVYFDFPSATLGLDAGAFAEIELGPRLGLRLDLRYTWGPEQQAEVTVGGLVDPRSVARTLPAEDVQRGLAPRPVAVDPSCFRAALVATWRF